MNQQAASRSYLGAVIYTDGSAKPNPGFTGWGVHGYFYQNLIEDKKQIVAKYHIATKYGYIHQNELGQNPRALPVKAELFFEGFGTGRPQSTNNSAEIDALYFSLCKINSEFEIEHLQIFTDSEYLRKGIVEWRDLWERFDYKRQDGSDIVNKDKWIRLFKEIDLLRSKQVKIHIDWVKGHQDNFGNVLADKLASLAMLYCTEGVEKNDFQFQPTKEYWKTDIERHPFLDFSRLYFNSQKQYNIIGQYFLADPGKDENLIGKRIPETSYCVLKINNGDPVIESIKKKQFEVAKDYNAIMMLRLDRVYQPDVYKYIHQHAQVALYLQQKNQIALNFIDQKPITVEMNPAGLSIRAIEALVFLENLMEKYIQLIDVENSVEQKNYQAKDITSYFYEEVTDKKNRTSKRLKSHITMDLEFVKIPIVLIKPDESLIQKDIPIVLGSDILRRNGLKKIEHLNPMVTLLTWYESSSSIRYATVIKTDDALGIWSNFYADRIFF